MYYKYRSKAVENVFKKIAHTQVTLTNLLIVCEARAQINEIKPSGSCLN